MARKKKRGLTDVVEDPLAKDSFVEEGDKRQKGNPPKVETKMLNTRIPRRMIKRLKVCCAHNETTIQELVTEALEEKLKAMGF